MCIFTVACTPCEASGVPLTIIIFLAYILPAHISSFRMSVPQVSVVPPPHFLQDPGNLSIPWEDWHIIFENYLDALDGQHFSAKRKKALLLSTLGKEGQRVFRYLPQALQANGEPLPDEYKEVVCRLEGRYAKEENLVMNHFKFYTHQQKPDETVDEFVAKLRELSIKCKLGAMCDELIRDHLMVHCYNRKVQERLWAAKNPPLKTAIDLAKVVEQSEVCIKELQKHNSPHEVSEVRDTSSEVSTQEEGGASNVAFLRNKNKLRKPPLSKNLQNVFKLWHKHSWT